MGRLSSVVWSAACFAAGYAASHFGLLAAAVDVLATLPDAHNKGVLVAALVALSTTFVGGLCMPLLRIVDHEQQRHEARTLAQLHTHADAGPQPRLHTSGGCGGGSAAVSSSWTSPVQPLPSQRHTGAAGSGESTRRRDATHREDRDL